MYPAPPLSLVNTTIVLSAIPSSSSVRVIRPTLRNG